MIKPSIWHDEKFRCLFNEEKTALLYLLTSPHANAAGFYSLPLEYMSYDLNLDIKKCGSVLERLQTYGMIAYDKKNKTVLVMSYLQHNPIYGPNQLKGVINCLREIPATPLMTTFYNLIKGHLTEQTEECLQEIKTLIPEVEASAKTGKGRK